MAPVEFLTVFRRGFLTLKSAALGRLVPDATNPGQEFFPIPIPKLQDEIVEVRHFNHVHNSFGRGSETGVWTKVSRFFSTKLSKKVTFSEGFDTDVLKCYTLLQPTLHFRALCKDEEAKVWIETTLEHSPIFLIVGLITVQAAAVSQSGHEQRDAAAKAEISASDILTGGASAILPAAGVDVDALSVGVGGLMGSSKDEKRSFVAPDERVIGIQYRKLKFKLFSKNKVDKASLKNIPNRWVSLLGGCRGSTEDVLDADLEDSMTADDLELDDEYDEKVDTDGQFVFIDDDEES